MARLLSVLVLLSVAVSVYCDIYMHGPRGCNNRNNEDGGGGRNNGNRLFRSENNGNGGYCWGPSLSYYAGSKLMVEWTNQHGCGSPNLQCNLVLQYLCADDNGAPEEVVRDGTTTDTIPRNLAGAQAVDEKGQLKYGMNENYYYYANCTNRNRNKGLFVADQQNNMGNSAQSTRQNTNQGNTYGYECGEEAVYYPYWHPSPWKDIVVFTNSKDQCKYYKKESQNVMDKNYCDGTPDQQKFNNENECKSNGGNWATQKSWGLDAPECLPAPFNRDNHLGNGASGFTNTYNWTLPTQKEESCVGSSSCSCVLRIRYNVSTAEVNWNLDSTSNGVNSPVTGDPYVMAGGSNLSLAIDTNEYGRTFQDRSFIFKLIARPSGVSDSATIYNLNVRGKRGNIVQVYPRVEYDFSPNDLSVTTGDYIHFQWTGCDNSGGGQAGEGLDASDRSNIVQIASLSHNYPMSDTEINAKGVSKLFENDADRTNLALLGQEGCLTYDELQADGNRDQNKNNCAKLNASPAYFNGGLIRMNNTGSFFYMSSRNNNFSNRTQKGTIVVKPVLPTYAIALIVVGGVVGVGAAATAGTVAYAKKNPSSGAAGFIAKVPGLNRI
eukprot:TRINITY_DN26_c0_g2_i1.p1 TRINITY_DN26_c0_g2~~TRINITY_DN26_c0_g2_i1.p1  ORF type:complete len:640 (-),score=131.03 TRINITY_DN26_c0_g2_i1:72-1889(-)